MLSDMDIKWFQILTGLLGGLGLFLLGMDMLSAALKAVAPRSRRGRRSGRSGWIRASSPAGLTAAPPRLRRTPRNVRQLRPRVRCAA